MTAAELLTRLRAQAVLIRPQEGNRLLVSVPTGALSDELRGQLKRLKAEVLALVAAGWWPAERRKPNLLDLGKAFGSPAVRAAFLDLGCDLDQRTPSWEEIYVVAGVLSQSMVEAPAQFRGAPTRKGGAA